MNNNTSQKVLNKTFYFYEENIEQFVGFFVCFWFTSQIFVQIFIGGCNISYSAILQHELFVFLASPAIWDVLYSPLYLWYYLRNDLYFYFYYIHYNNDAFYVQETVQSSTV